MAGSCYSSLTAFAVALLCPLLAVAELPHADALMRAVGFSVDDIGTVHGGGIVHGTLDASNERELVATLAFLVNRAPVELVADAKKGLSDKLGANTLAFQVFEGRATPEVFSKLKLEPSSEKRAEAYRSATPGDDHNLSPDEIATLSKLGPGASTADVERVLRTMLLLRTLAYQEQGLGGIAPYARGDGEARASAADLRSATVAMKGLQSWVPDAYQLLLDYPKAKPAESQEAFRWTQFMAHGVPTIALTHSLFVPEGDAWVVAQRQFYVSGGYNCEQAVAALIPVKKGTLVVYANRTSTDQVTGFGGSAKRAIGSRLLASELERIFEKIQAR